MEDQAWSVALSQQLSEQLGTCPHGSWEKVGSLPGSSLLAEPWCTQLCGWDWRRSAAHDGSCHRFPFPCHQKALPSMQLRGWLQASSVAGLSCSLGWWCPSWPVLLLTRWAVTTTQARPLFFQLFLYKALGSVLAACQDLSHVQEQLCRYLQGTNHVELSEAQVRFPLCAFLGQREGFSWPCCRPL